MEVIKRDFIVIEGNIGAGKSSLTNLIGKEYNAQIILERFADNPFLPKFYSDKERFSFPLELSFLADRYNQLKDEITSRDLFSAFTIADYYFMKSLIFSKSTLSKDEYGLYRQLFDIIYQSVPKPDLYVYLHVNVEKLLWNIQMRGRDYEQQISGDYLQSIQDGYFDFFKKQSDQRFLIIDTNYIDFVNNKEDYQRISELILSRNYPKGITREIL